jgi:hypothetical protein
VIETITKPAVKTTRSPIFSISKPEIGEEINLVNAKIETTVLAAKAVTPNDLANSGIAGATMPKPSATQKAIIANIQIAGGRSLKLPGAFGLVVNFNSL